MNEHLWNNIMGAAGDSDEEFWGAGDTPEDVREDQLADDELEAESARSDEDGDTITCPRCGNQMVDRGQCNSCGYHG